MKPLLKKLKSVWLPFIIVIIGFAISYTFLEWLLISGSGLIPAGEDMRIIWFPVLLSVIPVFIWLRPVFKRLDTRRIVKDALPFLTLFSVLAVAAPAILIQEYIKFSSEKLTPLQNIKAIAFNPPTKYYTVESFYADRDHAAVHLSSEKTGKNDESMRINIYLAVPLLSKKSDVNKYECHAWLGFKYSKVISNKLSLEEKNKAAEFFYNKTQEEFKDKKFDDIKYLFRPEESDDNNGFKEAVKESNRYPKNTENILLPSYKPLKERDSRMLIWCIISFGLACIILLLILRFSDLKDKNEIGQPVEPDAEESTPEKIRRFLLPGKSFIVTPVIICINILVFAVMVASGLGFFDFSTDDLLRWGGNCRPFTVSGQYWRLFTSVFLHGGIMHLTANMYALFYAGMFLEPRVGKGMFIFAYLLAGIVSGCVSLWWYPTSVGVGASGAIMGLYGVFLALLAGKAYPSDFRESFLVSTLVFIFYNLIAGLRGNTDNAAHIGGLLSGLIMGAAFLPVLRDVSVLKKGSWIVFASALFLLLVSALLIRNTDRPANAYASQAEAYAMLEKKALSLYNLPINSPKEKYIEAIEKDGIPNWIKCDSVLAAADSLKNLPENLKERNRLLRRYCNYRIASYRILLRSLRGSYLNERGLNAYTSKIDLILKKLDGENIADSMLVVRPDEIGQEGMLYLVDGTPVTDIDSLNPYDFESMYVLTGDAAYNLYGEKAKNGAVIIKTKHHDAGGRKEDDKKPSGNKTMATNP